MPPPSPTAITIRDRQPGDGDRRPAADTEDPALVVAADGQQVGARAVDGQVIRDAQLAAAQGDRAEQPVGEVDGVGAGVVGVGVQDRLAQRAVAGVGQVQDREGAGDRAVLQRFEPRAEPGADGPRRHRPAGAWGRTAGGPGSIGMTWVVSFACVVCGRMTTAPSGADRAPGRCRAGGGLLGGKDPTGRFFVTCWSDPWA